MQSALLRRDAVSDKPFLMPTPLWYVDNEQTVPFKVAPCQVLLCWRQPPHLKLAKKGRCRAHVTMTNAHSEKHLWQRKCSPGTHDDREK